MRIYTARRVNTSIEYDIRLANFIVAYFFIQGLNLFVKLVVGSFYGWDYLTRAMLIALLALCVAPIVKRGLLAAIVAELVLIYMFAYTIVSGGAVFDQYRSIIINSVTVFLPIGIALSLIKEKKLLLQKLYFFSWPTQILLILTLINVRNINYSMSGGYALAFQLLIVLDHYIAEKKWYDLLFVIIDALVILLFGSRGPIICIASFILLNVLFSNRLTTAKRIVTIFIIVIVTYLLYKNIYSLVGIIVNIANLFNFQSRNLMLFLNHSITNDSGRAELINYYLSIIPYNAAFGYGLAGGWKSISAYPHNLFVELIVSFGILFGVIACGLVVLITLKAITAKDTQTQRLAFILTAYCMSLFLSDSFVMCPMFYLLMALGLSSLNIRIFLGKRTRR